MDGLELRHVVTGSGGLPFDKLWQVISDQGLLQLWAASSASGALARLSLATGANLGADRPNWMGSGSTPVVYTDLVQGDLGGQSLFLVSDAASGGVRLHSYSGGATLGQTGWLQDQTGTALTLSEMLVVEQSTRSLLIASPATRDGLAVYQFGTSAEHVQSLGSSRDSEKTTLSGVSDLVTLHLGDTDFVIASSSEESGLSTYAVTARGGLELRDSLSPKDGLWISGLEDIATLTTGGQSFVVGVSAHSNTLSVVRINPIGAMFVTDVVMDTRDTRFAGAVALDVFEAAGHSFIITGGTDGGVSLFELLPGGQLLYHQSLIQSTAWDIGTVQDISAQVMGTEVQIILAGSKPGSLAQLVLPLDDLGQMRSGGGGADTLTGGNLDDVLLGRWGNDSVSGGAGDDHLYAGSGQDTLTGGSGADVFVFTADGQVDTITDFQIGQDRIDLDDWGMVYDISALAIRSTAWGAQIRWQAEVLNVHSATGTPLGADMWAQDDFIF